jgi:hypothetical protein
VILARHTRMLPDRSFADLVSDGDLAPDGDKRRQVHRVFGAPVTVRGESSDGDGAPVDGLPDEEP